MVKEERGLRTRLAAGSKRRVARRTQRRFQPPDHVLPRPLRGELEPAATTAWTWWQSHPNLRERTASPKSRPLPCATPPATAHLSSARSLGRRHGCPRSRPPPD